MKYDKESVLKGAAARSEKKPATGQSKRATQAKRKSKRAPAAPKNIDTTLVAPIVARVASRKTRKTATVTQIGVVGAKGEGSIAELIENWKPVRGCEEVLKVWDEVMPTVRKILLKVEIKNVEQARDYLQALSRHTAARFSGGNVIDDFEKLLCDDALAATLALSVTSTRAKSTRVRDLSHLRNIRAAVLLLSTDVRKALKYPRRQLPGRYSQSEITQLFAYARGNSSQDSSHLLAALLLCFGAGLTGRELSGALGSDLVSTPWGVVIQTQGLYSGGDRGAREVPVLAKYEDELSELAQKIGGDLFLGLTQEGKLQPPAKLQKRSTGVPVFSTGRARSNWMRELLENEVSFISLRKAGVVSASDSLIHQISNGLTPDDKSYITAVRGGMSNFDQSKHEHLKQYKVGM